MEKTTFIILGTTDAATTCERCGRTDLKKAIAVAEVIEGDSVSGEPMFVGTTCAANLTGKAVNLITRQAATADGRTLVGRFGSWAWTAKGTTITLKNLATRETPDLSELRPALAANIRAAIATAQNT